MRSIVVAAAAMALMAGAGQARAAIYHFAAPLRGVAATPPNASPGKGEVTAAVDTETGEMTWRADYSDTTGKVTGGQFHGPASRAAQAPAVVSVDGAGNPLGGAAHLTKAQISDLMSGRWYFSLSTAGHPDGELRGQLERDSD